MAVRLGGLERGSAMKQAGGRNGSGRRSGSGIHNLRWKLLAFAIVCALPLTGSVSFWLRGISLVPLTAYAIVSAVAFFLYWRDKSKAQTDSWRTPENLLHAVELAGGWPGALLAQQVFRHKTTSFRFSCCSG